MADAHTDKNRVISRRELLAYRAAFKLHIFKQIRKVFNTLKEREGFSQKELATALGIDEGLLSRRLKGENDMRLETFSDLARGLECKIDVNLIPISEIVRIAYIKKEQEYWGDNPSTYGMSGEGDYLKVSAPQKSRLVKSASPSEGSELTQEVGNITTAAVSHVI